MTGAPLVSCVMPTRNRRRFAEQAIWYFLRQDYPNRELVIVEDGDGSVADLVPADDRIRLIRLDEPATLGEKRNIGCRSARGELIAHWDDDAWIGLDRLSAQVAALGDRDVCGAERLLHYRLEAGQAWLRTFRNGGAPRLATGTLLYRRSLWAEHPFPETDGDDDLPHGAVPRERVRVLDDAPFCLAVLHGNRDAAADLTQPEWERGSMEEVCVRIGFDQDFYAALRQGGSVRPTTVARSTVAGITLVASFLLYDGYGSLSEYLALGLAQAGAAVNVVPISIDETGLSDELRDILARSRPDPGTPTLFYSSPQGHSDRFRDVGDLFVNTMWETSRLPAAWIPLLNRARTLIVPTRYVARVFRASGVRPPIEVIPEGIDPAVYHHEPRPERAGLTTLIVGTLAARKNNDVAIAAWKQAFADDPDARLVIKARFGYTRLDDGDARIRVVDSNETTRGIAHWYRQADVLLALGSEGFGLPLVEGMATGLPVIALDAAGQADVCADARGLMLPVGARHSRSFDEPAFGRCGQFPAPDVDDVAARLRWVADHRAEASEMGRAAAEWAPKARNIWDKGPAVLDVMEQRVQPRRALRRVPTMWVPSWGTPCGIADMSAHLARVLEGPIRVTGSRPDLATTRVLHVQYEPALFDAVELGACLEEATASGVRTAVTEHVVLPQAHAWERHATVIGTTTEQGVATLQARYPHRRVEHLPLGCPTWFPPRRKQRGKVIGAFGFLERQKGFWSLLDVLRELPGTRLLMFSYARDPDLEAEFTAAAEGLPVERVDSFLPAEEIAGRLAAETDLLAYWYDEQRYPIASGAARVGLATGVPVLTSATGWFADLRDVTYQPVDLVEGIATLLEDTTLRRRLANDVRAFCHDHSYEQMARQHRELWQSLEQT